MISPFSGKDMPIVKEWRTLRFRKDEFKVYFHSYRCEDTGEQFEDEGLAQLNYNQVVNQYREKHNIPFPGKIVSIREKYDLSAAKMSEILGFGTNSYRLYETGEVPSHSNARLIQMAEDPLEFGKLLGYCSTLPPRTKEKLRHRLEKLLDMQKLDSSGLLMEQVLSWPAKPGSLTGYMEPDFRKFTEMVVFFAETLRPWKTKLNKLLFYADFSLFQQTGFSMSGVPYRAIPMGPVPNNFNSAFEYLVNHNAIDVVYTRFGDGGIGEQYSPHSSRKFDVALFSEMEKKILHSVAERFKSTSTNQIIDISHAELAWIENQAEKRLIDYTYAFQLQ
ncbi:MAG: DUF4065 domain-containing protein [Bacteroidales bacterium]